MLTFNLERLKVFHRVYALLSIQRAADELHVSRSAVSQSLQALERELQVSLFQRSSKRFKASAFADRLFQAVDPLLGSLEQAIGAIETEKNEISGLMKIGAPLDFGSDRLTRVIARFQKKNPGVFVQLHLATPLEQLELLCAGKLDLCFIDNGEVHAKKYPVKIQIAECEEFVLAGAQRNFPRTLKKGEEFEFLSSCSFVDYFAHGPVIAMWFKHFFGKCPPNPSIRYAAESVRALLVAMNEGLGFGVVPRRLLKGSNLRVFEMQGKPWINQITIVRRDGATSTARETAFLKFYKEGLRIEKGIKRDA